MTSCRSKQALHRDLELGYTTDTLDATGRVLTRTPVQAGKAQVQTALEQFRGEIMQLPPMYSAIQINGRRLYDLARQGIEIEREKRPITIHHLELLEADEQENRYVIDVSCSKGTYIRTLCADIGEALGCGATMTALRRTQAAGFSLADSLTLEQAEQLAEQGKLTEHLLQVETVFESLPKIVLCAAQERMYRNGVRLDLARLDGMPALGNWAGDIRICGEDGTFLGVSYADWQQGLLCTRKLFAVE